MNSIGVYLIQIDAQFSLEALPDVSRDSRN